MTNVDTKFLALRRLECERLSIMEDALKVYANFHNWTRQNSWKKIVWKNVDTKGPDIARETLKEVKKLDKKIRKLRTDLGI